MGMGSGMGMGMMAGGWDNDYYTNNYLTNTCIGGCPINSHCEWGLCECNGGSMEDARKIGPPIRLPDHKTLTHFRLALTVQHVKL